MEKKTIISFSEKEIRAILAKYILEHDCVSVKMDTFKSVYTRVVEPETNKLGKATLKCYFEVVEHKEY